MITEKRHECSPKICPIVTNMKEIEQSCPCGGDCPSHEDDYEFCEGTVLMRQDKIMCGPWRATTKRLGSAPDPWELGDTVERLTLYFECDTCDHKEIHREDPDHRCDDMSSDLLFKLVLNDHPKLPI